MYLEIWRSIQCLVLSEKISIGIYPIIRCNSYIGIVSIDGSPGEFESLRYMMERRGPVQEPCGIPQVAFMALNADHSEN